MVLSRSLGTAERRVFFYEIRTGKVGTWFLRSVQCASRLLQGSVLSTGRLPSWFFRLMT